MQGVSDIGENSVFAHDRDPILGIGVVGKKA